MNNGGGTMAQLDFGALHYGDGKKLTFSVLNNSPKPARFFAACGTPQQLAEDTDATAPRDDPMTAFIQVVQTHSLHSRPVALTVTCAGHLAVCWHASSAAVMI